MKTYQLLARLGRPLARPWHRFLPSRRRAAEIATSRGGTVIIVVLALLGMLVLIGFFAFAFTASENQSATYFAGAAKVNSPSGIDPDLLFNNVLRQIIIGPSITERQSSLWGGNKSLLPTMFGRDMATFNGQGVNWIWNTTTNQPTVDQNYDNVPDTPGTVNTIPLLQLNLSLPAQGGVPLDLNNFPVAGSLYPDPDTNTTYPDINSAFLSYDALVPNPGSIALPTRVIIPSFHRPQLLRNVTATSATWYTDPATAKLVMYPHREHLALDSSGNLAVPATQRFVSAQYPDTTATPLNPFPIPNDGVTPPPMEGIWTTPGGGPITYDVDTDNDGVLDARYMDFGFPLMTTPDGSTQFVAMAAVKIIDADALYNLNVHGNRAGNVVLGPAPIPIPFGGPGAAPSPTQFISHSNLGVSASEVNPEWALNARPNAGGPDFPGTLAALQSALQQHVSFFRSPAQSGTLPTDDHSAGNYELANMEWWNILNGRPQLTPSASPTTIAASVSGSSLPGRWGENINHLDPNVLAVLGGTTPVVGGLGPLGSDPWPLPGTSGVDDNNNAPESGTFTDEQGIIHPPFVTPLDYFASGSWTVETLGSEGKARLLVAQGAQKFPQYANYFTNSSVLWTTFFNTTGGLMSGGGPRPLVDEPDETFTEPSAAATQADDQIFGPSENSGQMSGTDFAALGNPTRTASLVPFNMVANARAPQVRQRFTSTSWDLKSFGKEFLGVYAGVNDARRLWEFTDTSPGATGVGPFRFPPDFGTAPAIVAPALNVTAASTYPLRPDLAHLLWILADPKQKLGTTAQLLPQRPMSINGLTEQTQTGTDSLGNPIYTFRVRPLTPHPTATNPPATLTSAPIGTFPAITRPEQLTPGNVQQQEWLARYDRQRLARDIYTLLYLTGGGGDTFNYTTSNASIGGVRALYSEDQLQEMAQFAVNLVDQLDPDSNITIFEYDKNLADGWNLDDNPYDSTADPIPPIDRGVVYGVERQQLALNEAMVAFLQQAVDITPPTPIRWDHPDTQWDDTKQWAALYLELDNIGPSNVNFNNEQWQIAIKQSPIVAVPSAFYGAGTPNNSGERRLIFQASQPQLVAGAAAGGFKPRLTIGGLIGSTGGTTYDQINSLSGNPTIPNPSYLVIDPNDTTGTPANTGFDYQFPIVPRSAYVSPAAPPFGNTTALDLDLTQPGQQNQYWVVPPNGPSPTDPLGNADGAPITPPSGLSPGTQLLNFTDPIVEPTGTISSAPGAHIFPEASLVVRIELKRRVDPNRAPILPTDSNQVQESMDNPWIVVDYMDVPVSVLALKKTNSPSDYSQQIQYQLGNPAAPAGAYHQYLPTGGAAPLVSTERSQPLYHDFTLNPFKPTVPTTPNGPYTVATSVVYPRNGGATTLKASVWQGNSLGQDNDAAGFDPGTVSGTPTPAPAHPLYQPHYDRDFASIIELYNVPLWGPYAYLPSQPTAMNIPGQSSGNTVALSSGLTHLMGTRTNELGVAISGGFTPEVLGGTDFIPNDGALARQHYTGYGIAGYRFQHPEGSDSTVSVPTIDFTENRWHRWLGVVEVPTRSHRQLEEPPYQITEGTINGTPGFYRTPGKINLNTLRYPDVLAGLLDSGDVYSLSYSAAYPAGANFPANLSMPLSLPDLNGSDTFPAPSPVAGQRDWWTQFIMARDGIDPLATTALPNPGTGLPIPGMPRVPSGVAPPVGSTVPAGSHPFRGLGFSAFASANASPSGGIDVNRYNGTLDSTILRALPGDPVIPTTPTILPNSPDVRRGMFELGTANEHFADTVDYATKNRILSKILQNTTTRSNVFFVWIQVDFFQAKDVNPPNGVVRIGQKLATSPAYRGFFVVDRSQALGQMQPQFLPAVDQATNKFVFSLNQSFNYQSLVLFRQRIQ